MKCCAFFLFVALCSTSGNAYSITNERPVPTWTFRMVNSDNAPIPSRGLIIPPQNTGDSGNYFASTNNKVDYIQKARESLLPLVEWNGHFYYYEKYFKTNYFKATQYCREHGMDLVSIETSDEYMAIVSYMKKNFPKVEHIWTSGTDAGEEGAFVWLSTGRSLNFTNWGQGLPDNSGKVEHCLEILKYGAENYVWNDRTCTVEYNFICEVRE